MPTYQKMNIHYQIALLKNERLLLIIDKPLIFNKGFPGNLEADNLDGIIINVFILFNLN